MDRFGARRVGLFGIVFYCSALATLSTAEVDVTRSYDLVPWALVPLCVLTAALFLTLGRPRTCPRRQPRPAARDRPGPGLTVRNIRWQGCPPSANRSTRPAPVAQLDRALPSEGRGQRFESSRVRQFSCSQWLSTLRRATG